MVSGQWSAERPHADAAWTPASRRTEAAGARRRTVGPSRCYDEVEAWRDAVVVHVQAFDHVVLEGDSLLGERLWRVPLTDVVVVAHASTGGTQLSLLVHSVSELNHVTSDQSLSVSVMMMR